MCRELALWLALWVPTLLATIGTCIAWRGPHRLRLAMVVALLTPFRLCLPPGAASDACSSHRAGSNESHPGE